MPIDSVPMAKVINQQNNNNEGSANIRPPPAPPHAPVAAPPPPPFQQPFVIPEGYDEIRAREFLNMHKWPGGLQDTFIRNLEKIPVRYIIADDSGSMVASDGHIVMKDSLGNERLVGSSRWSELASSLKFHAGVARAANAPTEFRTLNSMAPIMVGTSDDPEGLNYLRLLDLLKNASPGGSTPLCRHIGEVVTKIRELAPRLRAANQRACVAIFSDGEATDGDLAAAMKPFEDLPVWVVVRLCTDEERIVEYWNQIDSKLELEIDVLDDLKGEAEEVYAQNPWLTYAEPMHRIREFGIPVRELDMLDFTLLSFEQIRNFCALIYGGTPDNYPHPEIQWPEFIDRVNAENTKLPRIWNPRNGSVEHWISVSKLKSSYKPSSCSIS